MGEDLKKAEGTPFVHLHVHTEYSILDGAARLCHGKHFPLIEFCQSHNMPAIAVTDHGNMFCAFTFYNAAKATGDKAIIEQAIKEKKTPKPTVDPIIGCEFYTCQDMTKREAKRNHLVLLAKDNDGYRNLIKLDSLAYVDGFYYKPRIDLNLLKQHSKGLVCLSGCISGKIPQLLLEDDYDGAKAYALELKAMFDDGDFYIELQDHGLTEEKKVLPLLKRIADEIGVKTVATNDAHYIKKEDAEMQDVMMCINSGAKVAATNRLKFSTDEFYLKTKEEMLELFSWVPEAVETPYEIYQKCKGVKIEKHDLFPPYTPDDGSTPQDYLRKMAYEGIVHRYGEMTAELKERTDYELEIIISKGFAEYYLIVWDFIHYSKTHDIPVGEGRGSGVGSIVAYAIGITNVDPIKYQLFFERFLNPERDSPPDFDIDFCFERRGEVIEYVTQKYGKDRVCQILALGTLKAKAAIKDVARVYDMPLPDVAKITKPIPNDPKINLDVVLGFDSTYKKVMLWKEYKAMIAKLSGAELNSVKKVWYEAETLDKQSDDDIKAAIANYEKETGQESSFETILPCDDIKARLTKQELEYIGVWRAKAHKFESLFPELIDSIKEPQAPEYSKLFCPEVRELYYNDEKAHKVIDMALRLEGFPRNITKHAAGVVICKEVISDFVPLQKNGEDVTTQFQKEEVENLGMLKMDFLGLKTLTDIDKAKKFIKKNRGVDVVFGTDYDDPEVYKLISSGQTDAVFQVESVGMKKFMKKLQPTCLEDIIAGVSLYRPGPMDSIDDYIEAKHNSDKIIYDDERLKPILENTYGALVYQEQVMQIVQVMGGYSLGRADLLRRAMGKKKKKVMDKERDIFIRGKEEVAAYVDAAGKEHKYEPAVEGAIKKGYSKEVAERVFDKMQKFASYAFNKSHAAAYSVLTYQTAYLKRYYMLEFIAAVINNRITSANEIKKYLTFIIDTGHRILLPDINKSDVGFIVEGDNIRFGLNGIKSVGANIAKQVIEIREEKGGFRTFSEAIKAFAKVGGSKKIIETLIYAGAFDSFGHTRSSLLACYERILVQKTEEKKREETGQMSMFDMLDNDTETSEIPNMAELDEKIKLSKENELLTIYISGHPLQRFKDEYQKMPFNLSLVRDLIVEESTEDNGEEGESSVSETGMTERDYQLNEWRRKDVIVCGIINDVKTFFTREKKKLMALNLEDLYGVIEVIIGEEGTRKYEELLVKEAIVKVKGRLNVNNNNILTLSGYSVEPWLLDEERIKEIEEEYYVNEIKVNVLYLNVVNEEKYNETAKILRTSKGKAKVLVKKDNKAFKYCDGVRLSDGLIASLIDVLGEDNVKYEYKE